MNTPILSQSQEERAPWNEKENRAIMFPVEVTETMTKKCDVTTKDYVFDGDGVDTKNVDWVSDYKEGHYTISELLAILRSMVTYQLEGKKLDYQTSFLKRVYNDLEGWETENIEAEEA